MTKTEIIDQIKSLEQQLADLKAEVEHTNDIGFEDDEIFLLSCDEYEIYKDVIPQSDIGYWLRDGLTANKYAYVSNVPDIVDHVDFIQEISRPIYRHGIRPAIKAPSSTYAVGDLVCFYNFPWVCIDAEKSLYIAEVPIAVREFGNGNTNVSYKDSYVRKFLKEWIKHR